jgi:hypothetical protein
MTSLVPFLMLPVGFCIAEARAKWVVWVAAASLGPLSVINTGLATNLNYIPDSVSNAVHHLVMPLIAQGVLSNNLLAFAGIPGPASGSLALVALIGAAVGALWLWRPSMKPLVGCGLAAGMAGGLFLVQGLIPSPQATPADLDAVRFLAERAVPKPGSASPPLFGP